MSPRVEARAHLEKAQEFLEAARHALEFELPSAATSSAVIAGINAKDAICLVLAGSTGKSEDHRQAVSDLRAAGKGGREVAPVLGRLLGLKSKSQYQPSAISDADARRAVEWAGRMVAAAALAIAS